MVVLVVGISKQQKRVCRLRTYPRCLLRSEKSFSRLAQLQKNGSIIFQQDAVIRQEDQRCLKITRGGGIIEPLFFEISGNRIGRGRPERIAFVLDSRATQGLPN